MKAKTRVRIVVAIVVAPLLALFVGLLWMRTPWAQAEFDRQEQPRPAREAARMEARQQTRDEQTRRELEATERRDQERVARDASERAEWEADGLGPAYDMIKDDWRTLQEWHDADTSNRNAIIHERLEQMIMRGHVRRSRAFDGAMHECMRSLDVPRNRDSTIPDVMYSCADRNGWLTTPSGHR